MQICSGLGGGIRVHSEVGQGTTFAFQITAYKTHPIHEPAESRISPV